MTQKACAMPRVDLAEESGRRVAIGTVTMAGIAPIDPCLYIHSAIIQYSTFVLALKPRQCALIHSRMLGRTGSPSLHTQHARCVVAVQPSLQKQHNMYKCIDSRQHPTSVTQHACINAETGLSPTTGNIRHKQKLCIVFHSLYKLR